jgi:hypothetical protein
MKIRERIRVEYVKEKGRKRTNKGDIGLERVQLMQKGKK